MSWLKGSGDRDIQLKYWQGSLTGEDDSSFLFELRFWLICNENKLHNNDFLPTVYWWRWKYAMKVIYGFKGDAQTLMMFVDD